MEAKDDVVYLKRAIDDIGRAVKKRGLTVEAWESMIDAIVETNPAFNALSPSDMEDVWVHKITVSKGFHHGDPCIKLVYRLGGKILDPSECTEIALMRADMAYVWSHTKGNFTPWEKS